MKGVKVTMHALSVSSMEPGPTPKLEIAVWHYFAVFKLRRFGDKLHDLLLLFEVKIWGGGGGNSQRRAAITACRRCSNMHCGDGCFIICIHPPQGKTGKTERRHSHSSSSRLASTPNHAGRSGGSDTPVSISSSDDDEHLSPITEPVAVGPDQREENGAAEKETPSMVWSGIVWCANNCTI